MGETTAQNREHVARTSADVTADRLAALAELYPEAFAEGAPDLDRLGAALGIGGAPRAERFSFSWAGKRDAIGILQMPSRATLLPCAGESVQWDETSNLFIEGDNLEVLKLLYRPYFGRVKVIYIDPPYNTGEDRIYPDNYADPLESYLRFTGQMDGDGSLMTSNPETSGRFHSAWLSMMYPRLFLARQLLAPDGSIWVSIDDREIGNLRQILNEVFGEENFVATFIWEKRTTRENRKVFSFNHDYVVCYAREKDVFQASRNLLPLSEKAAARYSNPDNDPRGDWQSVSLNAQAGHATAAQFYTIITPSGREVSAPPGRCWSVTRERFEELRADKRIWFGENGGNVPRLKVFRSEANEGLTPHTLWTAAEVGTTDSAKKALMELFGGKAVYDTPKPVELLRRILSIASAASGGEIALDFFAGSGTLAQATMELNRAESGDRRCILVQLPESLDEASDGKSAGYDNIAEICAERIRLVGSSLSDSQVGELELSARIDSGFRYFRLAESNYRPWAGVEAEGEEAYGETMALFTDPFVDDWQPEPVIWEVAVKEGFALTSALEELSAVKSNKVYRVRDPEKEQEFTICLDDEIAPETFAALGLGKDDLFICRDAALTDESAANLALQCRFKTI